MIVSVTTLKDTLPNVRKFVRRNLAGGIDHLVIFVDDRLPDVEQYLTDHPDVTCVPAYGEWWRNDRPARLNERQTTNSGLVTRLLSGYPWADWVFHVDGDEVVQLDPLLLARLDRSWRAVSLAPLEAVSRMRIDHDPVCFKRRLNTDQLVLLQSLGVIDRASNRAYFRGHVGGKLGVRPGPDIGLSIHRAWDAEGQQVPVFTDDRLRVLHYESPNGEEFVRKWLALLSSGSTVRHRSAREPLARAIHALLDQGLSEAETACQLQRLYERHAVDDAETLDRLGLLEHVDPDRLTRPRPPVPGEAKQQLWLLLNRARTVPKRQFRPRRPGRGVERTVRRIQRDVARA